MADGQRVPEPGSSIHYVSVGIEQNSRGINIDAKASVWYNALPTETVAETTARLAQAEAASVAVTRLTVASARTMLEGGDSADDVASFVALVNRLSTQIAHQLIE